MNYTGWSSFLKISLPSAKVDRCQVSWANCHNLAFVSPIVVQSKNKPTAQRRRKSQKIPVRSLVCQGPSGEKWSRLNFKLGSGNRGLNDVNVAQDWYQQLPNLHWIINISFLYCHTSYAHTAMYSLTLQQFVLNSRLFFRVHWNTFAHEHFSPLAVYLLICFSRKL